MQVRVRFWVVAGALSLSIAGCAMSAAPRTYPAHAVSADEAYARARGVFARALLYKPEEPSTGLLEAALSPLIVQEVVEAGRSGDPLSGIGMVYVTPDGSRHVDASQPTVYVDRRTDFIGGEIRAQTVVAWCHEVSLSKETSAVVCRGLRVTYDGEGYPLVWEVLDPALEADVVFVSFTVETQAGERYGAPVEGRRHRVERTPGERIRTIVPRVLDDGPMPMGPYVYLDARRGEVAAVLCRCMPSQVDQFVATSAYKTLPFSQLGALGRALVSGKAALTTRLRWPDGLQ